MLFHLCGLGSDGGQGLMDTTAASELGMREPVAGMDGAGFWDVGTPGLGQWGDNGGNDSVDDNLSRDRAGPRGGGAVNQDFQQTFHFGFGRGGAVLSPNLHRNCFSQCLVRMEALVIVLFMEMIRGLSTLEEELDGEEALLLEQCKQTLMQWVRYHHS
ncbi:uncharacterized protein [Physcomitrium patens]|uniref:uncharacterized protein isoform X1 n=2 Tax=Physcomitrium patens TaxID=3218 RepID=UPI000D15B01F|nr:uncharacterized protein LOC112278778 isoform X1 [Physcomitrium patens]|eukprot:XP_024368297.1 uncharacterized protein LOC112278778 isoform X1 [Physcomitrella patens]